MDKAAFEGFAIEVVRRIEGEPGFKVLPRRWVVERTFAWLGRNRRMRKDYEALPASEETGIYAASSRLLLRRLAAS
jgi:putative transposase